MLRCWEPETMFLGHQLPTFSTNTAVLDLTSCFSLTISSPSNFLLCLSVFISSFLNATLKILAKAKLTSVFHCVHAEKMRRRQVWKNSRPTYCALVSWGWGEGQTGERRPVEFFLWTELSCNILIIQLREGCGYCPFSSSFNYHFITLQLQKTEGEKLY